MGLIGSNRCQKMKAAYPSISASTYKQKQYNFVQTVSILTNRPIKRFSIIFFPKTMQILQHLTRPRPIYFLFFKSIDHLAHCICTMQCIFLHTKSITLTNSLGVPFPFKGFFIICDFCKLERQFVFYARRFCYDSLD